MDIWTPRTGQAGGDGPAAALLFITKNLSLLTPKPRSVCKVKPWLIGASSVQTLQLTQHFASSLWQLMHLGRQTH